MRSSKEREWVFTLYQDLKAILRAEDYLALWAYLYGLNAEILQTLESYLKKGMIVVEVGAHQGLYTLISASLVGSSGKVYAFEPVPSLARRLEENRRLNSISNIETFSCAVGAENKKANLYLSKPGGDEWSSFYQWRLTGKRYIEVDVVTIDEWVKKTHVEQIDLLKLDVEGSERDVLLGAAKSLKNGLINAAMVEINLDTQKAAGFSNGELYRSLSQYGFKWYPLPYFPNQPGTVDWSKLNQLCDLIAIRESRSDLPDRPE